MSLFAVGSYTHHKSPDIDARGEGIVIAEMDDSTGKVRILNRYGDIRNPTYLDWDSASRILYAVAEVGEGRGGVAAFSVSTPRADGCCSLDFLGRQEGNGRPGCHLTFLPASGRLFAASYSDGRLTGYPLNQGLPGPVFMEFQYKGSGPVSGRQDSAHAHQVTKSPHTDVLYVCDLGSDRIWMHTLGRLEVPPGPALTVPGGYGPRHLAFDLKSPVAYILCELVPKILVSEIDPGTGLMRVMDELDTVAADRMKMAAPAAVKVHPSGHTLAVSNRFDDTIAVFRIIRSDGSAGGGSGEAGTGDTKDAEATGEATTGPGGVGARDAGTDAIPENTISGDGVLSRTGSEGDVQVRLELSDRFNCRGKTPRDVSFTADGRALLIANQDSHTVTCRRFDPLSGRPSFLSAGNTSAESWGPVLETGSPVCLLILD